MTDEERQRRDAWQHYYHDAPVDFDPVAEEIFEAGWKAALARSDAEPVAWQWQEKATPEFGWAFCRNDEERFYLSQYPSKYNLRPLYTVPPRPDHELSAIAAAIGSSRFMDPPDGGNVSLAEQVCRMREALERAEAARPDASAGLIEVTDALEAYQREQENVGWDIDCMRAEKLRALAQSDAEPVIQTEFELDDGLHELAFPAPPRPDTSDPRYEISEVEGRFYVQRAGTDTVVAEFTDPPHPDASELETLMQDPRHKDNAK